MRRVKTELHWQNILFMNVLCLNLNQYNYVLIHSLVHVLKRRNTGQTKEFKFEDYRATRMKFRSKSTKCEPLGGKMFFYLHFCCLLSFSLNIYLFQRCGREGEKWRKTSILHVPQPVTEPTTQECSLIGIELVTFCFVRRCPTNQATPVRAGFLLLGEFLKGKMWAQEKRFRSKLLDFPLAYTYVKGQMSLFNVVQHNSFM